MPHLAFWESWKVCFGAIGRITSRVAGVWRVGNGEEASIFPMARQNTGAINRGRREGMLRMRT